MSGHTHHRWSLNTKGILKKAAQRLLNRQKRFGMGTKALVNFYRSITESVLAGCIAVWFGSLTARDCKKLKRTVQTAAKIVGKSFTTLASNRKSTTSLGTPVILLTDCSCSFHLKNVTGYSLIFYRQSGC